MLSPPRKTFPIKLSLKHILVLIYCLVLTGLSGWIIVEERASGPRLQVSSVEKGENTGQTRTLVFKGDGFSKRTRGYLVTTAISEHEYLWEVLSGKSVRAIAVSGDTLLAACMVDKLVRFDISDRLRPHIVDSFNLPQAGTAIEILGDRALVGMKNGGGVAVVDLSKPEEMSLVKQFPMKGAITKMASLGSYVYFTEHEHGVSRVDLDSDDLFVEPVIVMDKSWRLASSGRHLTVASRDNEVLLFAVSVSDSLELIASVKIDQKHSGAIRGLSIVGSRLLVFLVDREVQIYQIAGKDTFAVFEQMSLPGEPFSVITLPGEMKAIVSLVGSGLVQIKVPPSEEATVAGHLLHPTTFLAMAVSDNIVYTSGQGDHKGVAATTVSTFENDSLAPEYRVDYEHQTLHHWGGKVFGYKRDKRILEIGSLPVEKSAGAGKLLLAGDKDGVGVFTLSHNSIPSRFGTLIDENRAVEALMLGDELTLLHKKGLKIFAGPELNKMSLVGKLPISGNTLSLTPLSDNLLFVATAREGVLIVDITNRAEPAVVSRFQPPLYLQANSIVRDVVMDGSLVYVSLGSGGVYVLDVGDPRNPELLEIIDTPGVARSMILYEGVLFVADGSQGVFMLDVSNSRRIRPIGSILSPVAIMDIAALEDALIVSGHPGGTFKLPMPRRLNSLRLSKEGPLSVEVRQDRADYAYLYNDLGYTRVPLELH